MVAHHQSAGIGRLERTWESEAGDSVMLSFVFHSHSDVLPFFVGNAVLKVLNKYQKELALKWPNDLVIEHEGKVRKLGGIVLQRHSKDSKIVIAGIGINLQFSKSRPTEEAIALNELIRELPDVNKLIFELIAELSKEEFDVIAYYKNHCLTIGKEVIVQMLNGNDLTGRAVDVGSDGQLIVETTNGNVELLTGDVKHLRTSE